MKPPRRPTPAYVPSASVETVRYAAEGLSKLRLPRLADAALVCRTALPDARQIAFHYSTVSDAYASDTVVAALLFYQNRDLAQYATPCHFIASAIFRKPAMFAPATRFSLPSAVLQPYSLAAAAEFL